MNIAILLCSSLLIAPFEATNTISCYQKYTLNPTLDPTANPTSQPIVVAAPPTPPITLHPSVSVGTPSPVTINIDTPTEPPTMTNPNIEPCRRFSDADIIILNDISCGITSSQCKSKQSQIADTMISFINNPENDKLPSLRLGYIEFDSNEANIVYKLDGNYNEYVTQDKIDSYRDFIANEGGDCDNSMLRSNQGDLIKALDLAMEHFDDAESDNYERDRKIVIFSNCPISNTDEVCDKYEDYIRQGDDGASRGDNAALGVGINVVMVNQGFTDDTYLLCLTEYDDERIIVTPDFEDEIFYQDALPGIHDAVCMSPTPAPTSDPTTDPTTEPTANAYGYGYGNGNAYDEEPSNRLIRRLQDDNDYEVEFLRNNKNSPCIYLELNLETENLLPNNMEPDARTNIELIGRALGNSTGGTITVPDPIDREDDEPIDYDPTLNWTMDAQCEGEPQWEDTYWPGDNTTIPTNGTKAYPVADGFIIEIDIKTPDSIVYRFELDSLNLSISHDCADDLVMAVAVYLQDELVDQSRNLSIVDGDESIKTFYFDDTVKLKANKLYTVIFALIQGYPNGCDIGNVKYNGNGLADYFAVHSTARRLSDIEIIDYQDIPSQATADCCTATANLARSPEMQTGVSALCGPNIYGTKQSIEEGMFQQHASQAAIASHLFMTGSLHLFDENGTSTLNITDWPEHNVKEPCIAVDEDNRIIYAIGGHDGTGVAVDYIQGYKFDDESLTTGEPIDHLRGWRLREGRYGSECFFWNDNIVLISGMPNKSSELKQRSDFYKDMVMFEIKDYAFKPLEDYTDEELAAIEESPFISLEALLDPVIPYKTNPNPLKWNLIDAKPLLIGNDLFFFGGKTHKASKDYVSRMDLNNFETASSSDFQDGAQRDAGIELVKDAALPLLDEVYVNCTEEDDKEQVFKKCYMVFAGQKYTNYKLVEDGIDTDSVALYCNDEELGLEDIEQDEEDRRRLMSGEKVIPSFTEFDRRMLEKGKEMNRRRLTEGVETPESDVFMRTYHYGLDGLYYNFTIFIEQCYNNNDELAEAEESYTNLISSKESSDDRDEWIYFKDNLEDKILFSSTEAYRGWNEYGFGDVNIWDLQILNISYEKTPTPTTGCDGDYKHTERRKHRYYYKNYKDDDEDNFVWIDDQFDKDYADQDYENEGDLF